MSRSCSGACWYVWAQQIYLAIPFKITPLPLGQSGISVPGLMEKYCWIWVKERTVIWSQRRTIWYNKVFGMVWYVMAWHGMAWDVGYGVWYMIRYDIWYWYDIWYDTIRHDTMWYICVCVCVRVCEYVYRCKVRLHQCAGMNVIYLLAL